ncbi:MAG: sulfatase-like hydrolase/transferase [Planctomycetota bacterium]
MEKIRLIALFSVCLLWLGSGCERSGNSGRREAASKAKAAGCNVILITMDTTRADRIGCYGRKIAVTPALDALAARGVRFGQALAQAPITLPSHTTILTGTHPPEHGVRDNARYELGPELPTLAEAFQQHGYRTGAFIAAEVLNARYGLNRGFEVYDDEMPRSAAGRPLLDRRGDVVCDRALAWLEQHSHEPFMCWIHFFDPHPPYAPPPSYQPNDGDPYDGEVAFMDAQISRALNWIETKDLVSRTLIVAVGDHGESLGDHGYGYHATLVYESIMRVPLIVSLPERLPEGTTSKVLAGTVDVVPTLLELMGWSVPPEVTGESLVAALHGAERPGRVLYGESDFPYNSFGWSKLRCLTTEQWKYIRAPKVELYDRAADPGELRNVAEEYPNIVDQLEGELAALEARMTRREVDRIPLNAQTLTALQSLGYVGSSAPPPPESAALKNPIDMLDVECNYRLAVPLVVEGKADEAIVLLEPLVQRSPESFVLWEVLGEAYGTADRLEDAQQTLLRALALYPESAKTHATLAKVLAYRKRFGQAVEAARRALSYDPADEEAKRVLTLATADFAEQQAQVAAARQALASNPAAVDTRLRLSDLLLRTGQAREAQQVLREGLVLQPEDPLLADCLAWSLATSWDDGLRDAAEAVPLAQTACRGDGQRHAKPLTTLAAAFAEAGQFDEAVAAAREALAAANAAGDRHAAKVIERLLQHFQARRPYHEPP